MLPPLAERMRPQHLDDYIGQQHLVGEGAILRKMIESGSITSFILWGPPGVGKTTLARIISSKMNRGFYALSAVNSSVKEIREIIEKAKKSQFFDTPSPILFIDEIHRFSKSQQDSLLAAVENGTVMLIGATTENPSFEVITPLLSRCQVYVLKHLEEQDLLSLLNRVLEKDSVCRSKKIDVQETDALFRFSGGDARKLLNIIELLIGTENQSEIILTNKLVTEKLQENLAIYDKGGEMHYDIISAFIKSIRGSDPDAAVYWLARMIDGGEDPKFIARRLLISATEDVGLANPNALLLANACFDAVHKIGFPESRIILAETTIYLASSKKSNSAYLAIDKALDIVRKTGNLSVPLHLRNAPTALMKNLDYGKNYVYPHDYPHNFATQSYLPKELEKQSFWESQSNSTEITMSDWLRSLWKNRF
jgi:putative ATPase